MKSSYRFLVLLLIALHLGGCFGSGGEDVPFFLGSEDISSEEPDPNEPEPSENPPEEPAPPPEDPFLTTVSGDLKALVDAMSITGQDSNAFAVPASVARDQFRYAFDSLLRGNIQAARNGFEAIKLEVVHFYDAGGADFYLIREPEGSTPRGWGLYAVNPAPLKNIALEVPHPVADQFTEGEATDFFLTMKAKALLIAGSHRCANVTSSGCSGTTDVCTGSAAPYRISDASHSTQQLFEEAHEALIDFDASLVAVALHGFAETAGDPQAFVSDGTDDPASATSLVNQLKGLLTSTTSCNDGSPGATLCGTEDVQGRYANASANMCTADATSASGRFLHIEQSLDLRTPDGNANPDQLLQALDQLF